MNIDDVLLRSATLRALPENILRVTLKAHELLGVSLGLAFVAFRDNHGAVGARFVDSRLDALDAADALETARLLRERLEKLPERRRPHYSPTARYRILELKCRNGWSVDDTARRFALAPNTIYNWLARVNRLDDASDADADVAAALGSLIKPEPPVRRLADAVRNLVHTLDRIGFAGNGNEKLAQLLARAGYRLSARSVGRIRKEESDPAPSDTLDDAAENKAVLRAKSPNHIFMADVTELSGRFRIFQFRIAVVLDVFSRIPLAWKVFYFKPTARQMARLFQTAVLRFGKPAYFVSDHGAEFTGRAFRRYLRAIGVKHRFGAVGRYGSIAIVERFWRTLKENLRQRSDVPPIVRSQLEQRLRVKMLYYSHFRPHTGLEGATPAELYFRKTPRHLDARDPPRARAGCGPAQLPIRVAFLDKEHRIPVLIREAA